ncbi:putative N-acetylgalactosaminyl-diphosphoundecaprenol glucuronosyltransferase [Vibrio fluvialis PG41]|uniref:Putative N-acetylgalactosaminyl-diphosphoundecaprenol glucuronosyltransferase n=1 Tax=Vibrio fluvialis PG41 TaxID=1336752 RepID=S7IC69_VIBFL|nr:glycosyltransferase [Vibrio fluvialis]EPP25482.1 putative N-acetylgalactosaminyl-diphosphoundecaprenol glucuronosyltransferase [Vibrio fluvialis PG41]
MKENNSPTVGVILPTYNGERWLKYTINSVLNQSYKNIKLYIIDDGSNDNTINVIEHYIKNNPDRVSLVPKLGIKGAPSSRMDVIRNIDTELISFIDQDDIWIESKIDHQINHILNNDITLSFTDIDIIDEFGNIKENESKSENIKRNRFLYDKESSELAKDVVTYCPIRIGTVVMKRESFINSGGFDISLFGGEDWEFWVRYVAQGNSIGHLNNVLALRRIHSTNTSYIHRLKRLDNWMKAADKTKDNFPYLSRDIEKFYKLTYYRTIFSCLKKIDKEGACKVAELFKNKNITKKYDHILTSLIISTWPVVNQLYKKYTSLRNFILSRSQ